MIGGHDLRTYIVFRADLPEMTRAKGEVQAAHAASLIFRGMKDFPSRIKEYMGEIPYLEDSWDHIRNGQAKILMEVNDLPALMKIVERAKSRGVPGVLIQDTAHTVFDEPTITCVAFGPCGKTDGNALTRDAKMRK